MIIVIRIQIKALEKFTIFIGGGQARNGKIGLVGDIPLIQDGF